MSAANPDRARRQTTLAAALSRPTTTTASEAPAAAIGELLPIGEQPDNQQPMAELLPIGEQPANQQAQAVRQTGLSQAQGPRKRTSAPVRDDPAWRCVRVVGNADAHQPRVQCLGCGKDFSAGAARIKDHLFGTGGVACCSMCDADETFRANRLAVQQKITSAAQQKQRKLALAIQMVNSAGSMPPTPAGSSTQLSVAAVGGN